MLAPFAVTSPESQFVAVWYGKSKSEVLVWQPLCLLDCRQDIGTPSDQDPTAGGFASVPLQNLDKTLARPRARQTKFL
jgi:hypothetical protein